MRFARFALVVALVWLNAWALGADQDAVIFSDNFAQLDPGWGGDSSLRVEGNRLIVDVATPQSFHFKFYEGKRFDLTGADVRVKVAELAGATDQPAGLIFWAVDDRNYYAALLRADGGFYVVRRMAGQWLYPVPFTNLADFKPGLELANELRVVTSGASVAVYVNGREAAKFRGFPPAGESRIGVHAEAGAAASKWAYSDLSIRQGSAPPAATPAADAAVLFADDFATFDPGWTEPNQEYSVSDNTLILKPAAHSVASTLYRGTLFGDADIRVKIRETAGGTNSVAGIDFWATDINNCYAAFLRADGTFMVLQNVAGAWQTVLPMQVRAEIRTGLGQVNELRVVAVGASATFYVNDQQIARIDGYQHLELSQIGLHVESDNEVNAWAISDLVVRKPQ